MYDLCLLCASSKVRLRAGGGARRPLVGDTCVVHYHSSLQDGTVFGSSEGSLPVRFAIGGGNVIQVRPIARCLVPPAPPTTPPYMHAHTRTHATRLQAWSEAALSMRQHEKARFMVSSTKAYGAQGLALRVPPNAAVVLQLELLGWTSELAVGGVEGAVLKRVEAEGAPWDTPQPGISRVRVRLRGRVQEGGAVFADSREGVDEGKAGGEAGGEGCGARAAAGDEHAGAKEISRHGEGPEASGGLLALAAGRSESESDNESDSEDEGAGCHAWMLGEHPVDGLDVALATMGKRERASLLVAADAAYGAVGCKAGEGGELGPTLADVPPHAVLLYEPVEAVAERRYEAEDGERLRQPISLRCDADPHACVGDRVAGAGSPHATLPPCLWRPFPQRVLPAG